MTKLTYRDYSEDAKRKRKKILKISSAVLATVLTGSLAIGSNYIDVKKGSNGVYYINCPTNDEKPNIPSRYYGFNDYVTYKIVDGEKVKSFSSENIGLMIDKESHELKWYIFRGGLLGEVYELETGDMVACVKVDYRETAYNKTLLSKSYTFDMVDINNYLEGVTLKDSYTIDELKELEDELKEAVLIMNDVKTDTYSKKLKK